MFEFNTLIYEKDGISLYYGDSNFILPTLSKTEQFSVITDPPYGLKNELTRKWHGNNGATKFTDLNSWDVTLPDLVNSLLSHKQVILWGGNFYDLPKTDTWIIWDKLQNDRGSDAELAWAKLPKRGCRVFRMSRIDAYYNKRIFPKEHPHEKPIQLMEFCILKTTGVVLDPFSGAGSTLIAAKRLGRKALGIDNNLQYCEITIKRLKSLE